ncbi:heavy metal response regulator transcription factor [Paludibacterium purpuratum]|uniref:Two-component system copper resistance phosphate regulon response regulator CusR n=1 Tax=Paludibacterium purpuratum TaxID=1144873 RepID=A0A4R7B4Y6_9NEIS|nr:heavy metal response regulator transcription factor [Paludibacterium purpuratum]TDR77835.1 two-component system copper resistance phosphate regulon response regulator CusR [Paludibacterium purpuratum]
MKILVVEDEARTGDYLRQGLSEAGFVVDLARDGLDGLHLALSETYDLAVFDVTLPGMDGWQILKLVRSAGKDLPVLFLTARDAVEERVKGLELGADDYLVKPFAFAELLARIRSLLRRGSKSKDPDTLTIADLELDLMRRRVTRGGERIDLTAKEFLLLELLMRRQGEILPRSLIASQIWDMNFDSDTNVIEVAVRRLRAKIDDRFEPKLIRTVRGMGYVIEVPQ